jgi:hypothetical protein
MKSISKTKQRHSLVLIPLSIPLSIPRLESGDTNGKGVLGFEGESHIVGELFPENGGGATACFRLVKEEMALLRLTPIHRGGNFPELKGCRLTATPPRASSRRPGGRRGSR